MTIIALLAGAAGLLLLLGSSVLRRRARSAPGLPVDPEALRAEVLAALVEGGGPAAVRLYRRRTGAGLLEAKNAVDRIAGAAG